MNTKNAVLFFAISFLSQNALAGAWDMGSFDNDDALDWVYELESTSDLSAIITALTAVASNDSYIQAPTGSVAIAAAEVVAALRGNAHPQLPPEIVAWIDGRSLAKDDELVSLAKKAIAAVQHPTKSELAQLWGESGQYLADWKAGLSDLDQRLQ